MPRRSLYSWIRSSPGDLHKEPGPEFWRCARSEALTPHEYEAVNKQLREVDWSFELKPGEATQAALDKSWPTDADELCRRKTHVVILNMPLFSVSMAALRLASVDCVNSTQPRKMILAENAATKVRDELRSVAGRDEAKKATALALSKVIQALILRLQNIRLFAAGTPVLLFNLHACFYGSFWAAHICRLLHSPVL